MSKDRPSKITDIEFRYDSFKNGKILPGKKSGRLPAMGWNSWNAFGSGNTEALTKAMADKIIELGLNKLGYEYLVLDDGCYKSQRIDGKLSNEEVKFPSGFKALSDYIHAHGLKFGMYNDIGTNLCAGAAVGTCGHEEDDAQSYINWGVDFLKIDNCYYLWDNATFSNPENARYVFAPKIKSIIIKGCDNNDNKDFCKKLSAIKDGRICGASIRIDEDKSFVYGIGTLDGTNTGTSPVGQRSGELHFDFDCEREGEYQIEIEYASSKENLTGEWLQLAVNSEYFYDDLLPESPSKDSFIFSSPVKVMFKQGKNLIRIMNHRRQENTLDSYAAMLKGLNKAKADHQILLSLCEWGKTHPQNWGYKVGDSWRILNDITFRVGSDGNPGYGAWSDPGTPSVTSQYNKAVIMDDFAGLDKGWNDPDMLMIGMDGLNLTQNKTHFTMWCMMNSPLMLGLDLRRLKKEDELYNIISNKELIALNQDKLGIQAKRIATTFDCGKEAADKAYIEDINRIDILAKPLSDKSIAVSFINVSLKDWKGNLKISIDQIEKAFGKKLISHNKFMIYDLWTGKSWQNNDGVFEITELAACDNLTIKVLPVK